MNENYIKCICLNEGDYSNNEICIRLIIGYLTIRGVSFICRENYQGLSVIVFIKTKEEFQTLLSEATEFISWDDDRVIDINNYASSSFVEEIEALCLIETKKVITETINLYG